MEQSGLLLLGEEEKQIIVMNKLISCTSNLNSSAQDPSVSFQYFKYILLTSLLRLSLLCLFKLGDKNYQQKMYFGVYFWEHVGYLTSSFFVSSQFMYQPIIIAWVQAAAHFCSLC